MCDVIWCHTTAEGAAIIWTALIGLVGAAGAIIGAVVVGLRQSAILSKQADIAERVASIEELKLKRELFDARFAVYLATREWLRFIISEARPPRKGPNAVDGEEAIIDEFVSEWDRSRFLFRPSVHRDLRALLTLSHRLHYHQQRINAPNDNDVDHVEHERQILLELYAAGEKVSDIFGDELLLANYVGDRPEDIVEIEDGP